ncbi:ECF transporter S component [Nakamurella deserti]|uniref:ECF transporter S component n=1 Tax=Nakamurella deserti TaxID=2164074 RepID=UPI000DBE81D2|nr:ECF transporter S component [Nakamurella deserti]
MSGIRAWPLGVRSAVVLTAATVAGLLLFGWPLLIGNAPTAVQDAQAPFVVVALLPVLVLLVVAQLSDGGLSATTLAMLGVLSAVNAALRPLGAGTAGIELVFFLLILSGRVFGPGFGFMLGITSLFASALLTAGVGPWLPFQMLAAAWVGMGAGLLPRRVRGVAEIVMLALYGVLAAYAFGLLMNLSSWPFAVSAGFDTPGLAYLPGASPGENLHRFVVYTLITSTAGWDTGRALTNVVAISVLGPAVLTVLRRAARRARFDAPSR